MADKHLDCRNLIRRIPFFAALTEDEAVRLSRAEQVAFVSALLKPPAPAARLRRAAAAYRKQVGR